MRRIPVVLTAIAALAAPGRLAADRVVLRDGFELTGVLSLDRGRVAVRTDLKTYLLSAAQIVEPEVADPEEPPETYALSQPVLKVGRRIESVPRVLDSDPFDQFGRRTLRLEDNKGKPFPVHQAITEIHPSHVVLEGINCVWRSCIALSDVPNDELLAILEQASDSKSLPSQLKLINFLVQARLYSQARGVLDRVQRQYPEGASQVQPLAEKLSSRLSRDGLAAARRAIRAGQISIARTIIGEFQKTGAPPPDGAEWAVLAEQLDELERDLDRARSTILRDLESPAGVGAAVSFRAVAQEAAELVGPGSLERLRPLLSLADQLDATPESRLALAATGWIAGPNLAQKEPEAAARMAVQRDLLIRAIDAPSNDELEIRLDALRSSGVSADLVAHMIPLLPAPAPPPAAAAGEQAELWTREGGGVGYRILLPADYNRARGHPLIATLHGLHTSPERQIDFWKSAGAQLGAIVVAPDYLLGPGQPYEYSTEEHDRVTAVLADVRRRFAVDSNRVFLSGHEVGAFAAFDYAMGHPDEFAGLIAFSGAPMFYAQYYWRNTAHLPMYAVEGQYNGGNPGLLRTQFERFFQQGRPTIYVEYSGRGGGMFPSELPTILDWMERKTRDPFPGEVEASSARHSDRRFYWVEADAYMPNAVIPPKLFDKRKGLRPAKISASLSANHTIDVQAAGLKSLYVLLSPQFIHVDDPALTVRVNRKVVHAGPIEPDLATLVRRVRRTGDKNRLIVKEIFAQP
jgi:acetyl esterase/lipase